MYAVSSNLCLHKVISLYDIALVVIKNDNFRFQFATHIIRFVFLTHIYISLRMKKNKNISVDVKLSSKDELNNLRLYENKKGHYYSKIF